MKARNISKLQNGFTLIEVAIVMVIIGLALAASIAPLSSQIERSKIAETNEILKDVMEALYGFAALPANARLPCPATINPAAVGLEGMENPVGGGPCVLQHGFVPGRTLNISGKYSPDGLLLDAWGNPIRYSVAQSDADTDGFPDFTSFDTVTVPNIADLRDVLANQPPLPAAELVICGSASTTTTDCSNNDTLSENAAAVIISLGKDGATALAGSPPLGADQALNTSIATSGVGAISGMNYLLKSPGNVVFVSKAFFDNTANAATFYNDQVMWISPFALYSRMYRSGALP